MGTPTDGTAKYRSADAGASAAPIDAAAIHVDPRVVETLGRWRHVDTHSMHSLASALTTEAGDPAVNNSHYLSALHGFVAEQLTSDHLGVVLPSKTSVAALDLYFHGEAVQIKEGASAYELVHHALRRYPEIRTFATDPATAERLQAEGISAIPIPGIDPDHIANITTKSMVGLDALEKAGAISLPLITTALAICRYWERYDSGRSDARSALQNAAVDVGAQAIGTAVGLKLGSIAVVASSSFALAAIPITGGAIAGALGLRMQIEKYRESKVAVLLEEFDEVKFAAEQSSSIAVELSREHLKSSLVCLNEQGDSLSESGVKLEVLTSYLSLIDQLLTIARPVTESLSRVEAEADRLGVEIKRA